MSYQIYARKYRPMTFEEVIGQKAVVRTLQNAVKNDRVSQAYLFSGMRGVGKTTVARILAKALNCKEGPTPTPCNKCEFCTAVIDDRSVDVLEIDGASNRGIDEVRSLREGVKYKPIHSRYKVIIIDEVHMLTREAFNALLKTLEEPPAHTVFIFATTEFYKVPATIVSRCQHFEFKKISQKELINHLLDITKKENITISPFGLNLIAEAADGSLRDVLSLLDQAVAFSGENIGDEDLKEILGSISHDLLLRFSRAILEERADVVFPLVEKIIAHGYDLRFFYKELILHFRNLLLIRTMENPGELLPMNAEELQSLRDVAENAAPEELLRYLTALQEGEQELKFSSHPRIYLEMLLVRLSHFKKVIPLKSVLKDIEELKKEIKESFGRQKGVDFVPADYNRNRNEPVYPAPPSKNDVQVRNAELSTPRQESQRTSSPQKQEKRMKKDKEMDVAMKDPTVKNFMDTFKAQILSVEQINKKKK
ncbi:MAG: DNA polymerase III subunit gamma/tau [Candidatus Aminicenantes bacterium]|nr:DNA polymerase III subunit gamma/tau [Candidatus Aminicenantes bacterium]